MATILTIIGLVINTIALLITIYKLNRSIIKENTLLEKKERRIEYKLKICQILYLSEEGYSIEDIIDELKNHNPTTSNIDHVEIRKSIYEMLVEDTIVICEDGTYMLNTCE